MKTTVTSSNRVYGRCNMIKKGVTDLEEGVGLVHSIVIFCIWCFFHSLSPEGAIICIMQNMVWVSGTQMFNREVVKIVVHNNVVKNICNVKGIIKASGSTVINGDG